MYLEKFVLPTDENGVYMSYYYENGGYVDNQYPCGIFTKAGLTELDFEKITVLAGSNGSGKSTLLNLIACKLGLDRIAPYNGGELFDRYTRACRYRTGYDDTGVKTRIPIGSAVIASDDVFDHMLTVRSANAEYADDSAFAKGEYGRLFWGDSIRFTGVDSPDYERFRMQVRARRPSVSRRKFVLRETGGEIKLFSNGETALEYFDAKLKDGKLYCLDEPENSLSPQKQIVLKQILEEKARYCGCQFVIATHSPFLMALEGAKIYDLDAVPADIKKWWELPNTRTYYEFFRDNAEFFKRTDFDRRG